MNAFRLALRVLRVDRRTRTSALLTALGVAVATSLVLLLLGLPNAVGSRESRSAWQDGASASMGQPHLASALIKISSDRAGTEVIERIDMALTGKGELEPPPGVDKLPGPGESLLSPALAKLVDSQPGSALGERFGNVVGQIGAEGLRFDDQLVALVGHRASDMGPAMPITAFATSETYTDDTLQLLAGVGLVVLLVPSLVLVASAARLTATRREQRLSALRLCGATPRQVIDMVVAELAIPTVAGVVLGVAVNPLARAWAAGVPWDGGDWYASDLATPLWLTIATIVCLPVLVLAAAAAGLKGVVITPLGAATRQPSKPVGRWRLLSLPAAALAFWLAARSGSGNMVVLVALGGMIASAAIIGPWVTAAAGRVLVRNWRGPAALLAGRRLHTDPKAAYRASAGVVLAVFVGAMALTLLPTFESSAYGPPEPTFAASTLRMASDTEEAAELVARIDDRLERYGQNERAVQLDEVVLVDNEGWDVDAYIVKCSEAAPALGLSPEVCAEQPAIYGLDSAATAITFSYEGPRLPLDKTPTADLPRPVVLIDPELVPSGFEAKSSEIVVPTTDANRDVVRTAMVAASAGNQVFSDDDMITHDWSRLDELRRITAIGVIVAGLLAGCSAAITTAGSVMDRRRTFGAMIAAGTQSSVLARTLRVEAALPAVIATVGAGVAGTLAGVVLFSLVDSPTEIVLTPWLFAPVVVGIIVALLAASVCGPALRRVREEPLSDE